MREYDLTTEFGRQHLAEIKAQYDRPENRVTVDGKTICYQCRLDWDTYTHGC